MKHTYRRGTRREPIGLAVDHAINKSIIDKSIESSGLSRDSFIRILTQTALSKLKFWTETDIERLLLTAQNLNLDPLCMDVYAVPNLTAGLFSQDTEDDQDSKTKFKSPPVSIIVSLQGWMKMINSHPQFSGVSFKEPDSSENSMPAWMECTIYRKDRVTPITVREYMVEVNCMTGAWITHPRRMLRHKSLVQSARLAFGFQSSYIADSLDEQNPVSQFNGQEIFKGRVSKQRSPIDMTHLKSALKSDSIRPF
jgi:hypothetical protein